MKQDMENLRLFFQDSIAFLDWILDSFLNQFKLAPTFDLSGVAVWKYAGRRYENRSSDGREHKSLGGKPRHEFESQCIQGLDPHTIDEKLLSWARSEEEKKSNNSLLRDRSCFKFVSAASVIFLARDKRVQENFDGEVFEWKIFFIEKQCDSLLKFEIQSFRISGDSTFKIIEIQFENDSGYTTIKNNKMNCEKNFEFKVDRGLQSSMLL